MNKIKRNNAQSFVKKKENSFTLALLIQFTLHFHFKTGPFISYNSSLICIFCYPITFKLSINEHPILYQQIKKQGMLQVHEHDWV